MSFDIGDVATLDFTVAVDGTPTNADVELTITTPDGESNTPTPDNPDDGEYTYDFLTTMGGLHTARWVATGAATAAQVETFWVGTGISVADVKKALNKSLTVDDDEIQRMLNAALAEYEEWVGPVSGEVTRTFDGGQVSLILPHPNVTELTAAAYSDGTPIDVADLVVDNGIVYWGYNTAGLFNWGRRNVTVTYTVGGLPANHREAIIADVAGYFAATQRGPLGRPGEGYEEAFTQSPLNLFPRIRALAAPSVA